MRSLSSLLTDTFSRILRLDLSAVFAVAIVLTFLSAVDSTARAQAVYGSIIGTVTDPSGAVVRMLPSR